MSKIAALVFVFIHFLSTGYAQNNFDNLKECVYDSAHVRHGNNGQYPMVGRKINIFSDNNYITTHSNIGYDGNFIDSFIYDSNNQLIEINRYATIGINISNLTDKTTYIRDLSGNIIDVLRQNVNVTTQSLKDSMRVALTWDSNNMLLDSTVYLQNYNNTALEATHKVIFDYNTNNQLSSSINFYWSNVNNDWDTTMFSTYEYNNLNDIALKYTISYTNSVPNNFVTLVNYLYNSDNTIKCRIRKDSSILQSSYISIADSFYYANGIFDYRIHYFNSMSTPFFKCKYTLNENGEASGYHLFYDMDSNTREYREEHITTFYCRGVNHDEDEEEEETSIAAVDQKSNIKFYPNPILNHQVLNIETHKDTDIVSILNITGTVVELIKLKKGINKIAINQLSRGIYILKTKNSTQKLVVL